ncbi:MAG: serine protease [Blastococcus sp.]|jgi:hypothetical protein|nr:serine protease [Blastococcus sp.]
MVLTTSKLAAGEWNAAEDFQPITYEKVIGLNNLLSIAWLSQGLTLAAAVARIVLPEGAGTGFLIAPDLLLTNNHVLPDADVARTCTVEFNYQANWTGSLEPVKRFTVDPDHFRTSVELDYTIVRVKESPGDLYGYIDLATRADVAVNDFVSIIQHPMGGLKQVCLTDNKVAAVFGHLVQYSTDTEPGSSGSPVFNQNWQLVALHHRGGNLQGPDGTKYFSNEGISIGSVYRDAASFLGVPDALYNLAFGDLRAILINLVDVVDPPTDPHAVAAGLLRTQPRFSSSLDDWATLNAAAPDARAAGLAAAGIATGVALRQWARTSGHESVATAATPDPSPAEALYALAAPFKGTGQLPSDVYAAVLTALRAAPDILAPIVAASPAAPGGSATVTSAHAFVLGVMAGARAYDGPVAQAAGTPS